VIAEWRGDHGLEFPVVRVWKVASIKGGVELRSRRRLWDVEVEGNVGGKLGSLVGLCYIWGERRKLGLRKRKRGKRWSARGREG